MPDESLPPQPNCPECGAEKAHRAGFAKNGTAKYVCKKCRRCFRESTAQGAERAAQTRGRSDSLRNLPVPETLMWMKLAIKDETPEDPIEVKKMRTFWRSSKGEFLTKLARLEGEYLKLQAKEPAGQSGREPMIRGQAAAEKVKVEDAAKVAKALEPSKAEELIEKLLADGREAAQAEGQRLRELRAGVAVLPAQGQ